ncbi:MAG: SDR family oxidoreductase [Haliea sp.]|jgi:short-subunit dehydrogenase|nr:SDR family oxidoreductase [Haliea sp.]MDP5063342.1 SDR family oxidoreductase [Haliea sp.]
MHIDGKRILLTGAAGGIGAASAKELAGAGALLTLVSRNAQALEALLGQLPGDGHRVLVADLATSAGRAAVIAAGQDVDGLINNAGVNPFGMFAQQSEAEWRQALELNLMVPMLLIQGLLAALQARQGWVVNVGSAFGSIGFPGSAAYSASKFGLRGLTEALRRELAGTGVSLHYLAPRATATEINAGPMAAMNTEMGTAVDQPDRVARELLALLRSGKGARYVGWPERFFIKLNSVFPALVEKSLVKQLPVIRRYALADTGVGE